MATGAFMVAPYIQLCDATGAPLSGGLVYTYAAGTSVWQKVYTDSALLVEHPQPIQLDSAGRFAGYAQTLAYKIVVKKSDGSSWWTQDDYYLPSPVSASTLTVPDWMTALIW